MTSIRNYERIAVIGISASGKSTLAVEFGKKTGLPVWHLDRLFWDTNWKKKPREQWREQEAVILLQDRWIVEGYIDGDHAERLQRAQLVIYLDLPGFVCVSHGLLRWWKYRKTPRPELPTGCTEKLDYSHLWTIAACKERRAIQAALERVSPREIIVLKSERAIRRWLESLEL
jgi:adenylate kinase family enzyme